MLPEGAKPIIATAEEAPLARPGGGVSGNGGGGRNWGRWIAFLFVFAAVVGFGSLLAYTYLETRDGPVDPNSLPVVRADARPMKIRPDTPGGIDVPFQDKEIFERVGQQAAGNRPGTPQQQAAQRPAERLMPGPEQPLPRPVPMPPPAPTVAVPAAPDVAPPPNAVPVTPPPRASVPPGGAANPAPPPQQQPQAPAPAQVAQAPRAAPAVSAPASGVRIQLASVRSEADAQREWERMRRQHADLLGNLSPAFPSADLGDRGTFWRVQAGGFADPAAAQETCAALRGRGLGCNVVR